MALRLVRFGLRSLTLTFAACWLAPPRAAAQVLYGSIAGTVRDSTSAPVPGAAVRITNVATNQSRESVSNDSGEFSFASLEAGAYDLKVRKEGFQSSTTTGLRVDVDQTARVTTVLIVGAVSESVVVSAKAVSLQTDSAEVRGQVSAEQLQNVPIPINRNFESLLIEIPGITPPENANSGAANPARGLTMSASGTPRNMNNIRIDGASANNVWLPYVVEVWAGLESIEEVSVVTSNFDVAQGLAGGLAVNVHIKSGGNAMHGSAFWSQINNAWGSRPFFLPANERNGKFINNVGGGHWGTHPEGQAVLFRVVRRALPWPERAKQQPYRAHQGNARRRFLAGDKERNLRPEDRKSGRNGARGVCRLYF